MSVPIIMPCLNRFDMLTEAFETVDTDIRPFVIDQWRKNRGVSGAWNLGMQRVLDAGREHAIVCNDDIKFYPGVIKKLYDTLLETGAALVSPRQIRKNREDMLFSDPVSFDGVIRPGADFFCFAVNIPMLTESVGWFDENIYPAYFEDNDMHFRMIRYGLESFVHDGLPVFHEGSKTQTFIPKQPVTDDFAFEKNKAYVSKKWGGKPGEETYQLPWNNSELSLKDWPGSHYFGGQDKTELFDAIGWDDFDLKPQLGFFTE